MKKVLLTESEYRKVCSVLDESYSDYKNISFDKVSRLYNVIKRNRKLSKEKIDELTSMLDCFCENIDKYDRIDKNNIKITYLLETSLDNMSFSFRYEGEGCIMQISDFEDYEYTISSNFNSEEREEDTAEQFIKYTIPYIVKNLNEYVEENYIDTKALESALGYFIDEQYPEITSYDVSVVRNGTSVRVSLDVEVNDTTVNLRKFPTYFVDEIGNDEDIIPRNFGVGYSKYKGYGKTEQYIDFIISKD